MPAIPVPILSWFRNELDFRLRNLIRLRRGAPRLPAEPKEGLFAPNAVPVVERMVQEYRLSRWQQEAGRVDFAASLYYGAMVEHALRSAGVVLPDPLRVLDAGAGDWFYVQPVYGVLRYWGASHGRSVRLDGVELDAYALYRGFRSRYDWAEAYAGGLEDAHYIAGDLRGYTTRVDLSLMLFPFLFGSDLRQWGLPSRYLRPAEVLAHVWGLVRPGGILLIANLGEAERDEQQRLLGELGIEPAWAGQFDSPLYTYRQPRFLTVVTKSR